MSNYFHSQYRGGELAVPAAGKNDGNENWDISHHPYTAAHESGDPHQGKPVGTVTYADGEFICRISAQNRDWFFRAMTLNTLTDSVRRFFGVGRGKIKFRLDRAADLARFGEAGALGRL
jgi:hypothetical protein